MTSTVDPRSNEKNQPKDLTHHFSRSSRKRVRNVMKEYYRFLTIPGMSSFAGGSPFPGYFPIDELTASIVRPDSLMLHHDSSDELLGKSSAFQSLHIKRVPNQPDSFRQIDLDSALKYGIAQGYPPLYAVLKKLANSTYHPNIPYRGGADVVITGGAADGLAKVYDLLFNEWDESVNEKKDREGLMIEEMVYAPPIAQVKHKDVNVVPLKMDNEGLLAAGPGSLEDVLENWNIADGRRPHVLYLIPTGQNPTSGVLSLPRRRQIYETCSRFDVIIIEDDPYWTLFYPSAQSLSANTPDVTSSADVPNKLCHSYSIQSLQGSSTGFEFLDSLVPSFLNLDTDGRVIRLDTFSKTIAPGCRLGWITAQPSICEQLVRITDATTQQPSGFVQGIVAGMLIGSESNGECNDDIDSMPSGWGLHGWVHWLEELRNQYQRRMTTMAKVFEQGRFTQQKVEMFSFNWPMGGMFIWLKIHVDTHPLASVVAPKRLMLALWILCTQQPYHVLINPGKDFAASDIIRDKDGCPYLRFCFAAIEESLLMKKSYSFVDACRQFWNMGKVNDIDGVLQMEDARRSTISQTGAEDEEIERLVIITDG